jgi:hypothetical protein
MLNARFLSEHSRLQSKPRLNALGARFGDKEHGKVKGEELDALTLEYMKHEHPGCYESIVFQSSTAPHV